MQPAFSPSPRQNPVNLLGMKGDVLGDFDGRDRPAGFGTRDGRSPIRPTFCQIRATLAALCYPRRRHFSESEPRPRGLRAADFRQAIASLPPVDECGGLKKTSVKIVLEDCGKRNFLCITRSFLRAWWGIPCKTCVLKTEHFHQNSASGSRAELHIFCFSGLRSGALGPPRP